MSRSTDKNKVHQNYSRREFINASGLVAGAVGVLAVSSRVLAQDTGMPKGSSRGLPIIVAGYKYNRVEALVDGRVKIEGCAMGNSNRRKLAT